MRGPSKDVEPGSPDGADVVGSEAEGGARDPRLDVERLRGALAELEDAKLRVQRNAEEEIHRLRVKVLEELIPVLTNLDRSIAAAEHSPDQALIAGLRHVHAQFLAVLAGFGLERESALGQRFDPRRHDAIAMVPVSDPAHDGLVVEEFQPAYLFGTTVVSPARVQVGRAARRGPDLVS